jgi:hypothetical protein
MAKRKVMAVPVHAMTDVEWRARDDARTLMEATKIKKDPKRLAAAKKSAKAMLEEAREQVAAARAIAA